jgi:hypothetical protein
MSEYLSALMSRTVGRESPLLRTLEPRVNSQYEARSPAISSDALDMEAHEVADVLHAASQGENASPVQRIANQERRTPATGEPAAPIVLPYVTNDPAVQVTATSLLAPIRDQVVQRSFEKQVVREIIRERSSVEKIPAEGLRPLTPPAERPQETIRPQVLVRDDASSQQKEPAAAPRPPQSTEARGPVLQPVVTLERELPRPARSAPASPDPRSASKETSAPSIQVTIGRLEIRTATASPAPKPREKTLAGPTSLDDYMRKRNGGSR